MKRDLDPYAMALAGDCGAVEPRPVIGPPARRRRPRTLTALVLLCWLAWEASGVARTVAVGRPILAAIWSERR